MNTLLKSEWLKLASRIALALIFIFFAISKIADPLKFASEISNYRILPDYLINIMAITLPWVELATGFILLTGVRIKASALLCAAMMLMFIGAVGIAMMKGLNISCGCSGSHSSQVGWKKILENTALLILSIYLVFFSDSKISADYISKKE
jgi:uncharacterized membrane protein YphA (DoxX/SURF4 family)